ncbi:NAD(P)-binding protein [soil metagenome]
MLAGVSSHTPRVAVVGAGLAGAACARALTAGGVVVEVHDRGRVPGGRMASPRVGERRVDVGASYFTVRHEGFCAVVDDWRDRGLARPWTDAFHLAGPGGLGELKPGPVRWAGRDGLRSLVADLLTGLDVRQSSAAGSVGLGPTLDGRAYDAVVLALPDPQAAPLLHPSLEAERAAVADRVWEPVLALAAGWDQRCWLEAFDGCFVEGSDVLGWVADDGRRRGDGAPVLVAHSTSAWASTRLSKPAAAAGELVAALREVLQVGNPPGWTTVQRWTYARPAVSRDSPFHLGPSRVGLCGDGWGSPRVETAWTSGDALGRALAAELLPG